MSTGERKALWAAVGCAGLGAALFSCVGGVGLVWWLTQTQAAEAAEPVDSDPFVDVAPPDEPPPPLDPIDPPPTVEQMRERYRPGPYVEVQGMLPDGRMRQRRMAGTWRQGRTVDNPWIVGGAELRPGAAPSPSGAGAPSLRSTAPGELTVLAGVPSTIGVSAQPGNGADGDVQGLIIAFHDYQGYFFLPATVDTELGHIRIAGVEDAEVHFGIDSPVRPDGSAIAGPDPYRVTMYVASVDMANRISPYVQRELVVMPVGNGDVEVTLSMTEATDLDLYVVDPTGVVVYYGNDGGMSGGQLDLDANAACSGNMGVNTEHVFWPAGEAPAGTYTVRVAHFESCVSGRPVDYRITVRNCGETVVLSGRFEGQGDTTTCDRSPGTNRNWCQDVVEFEVTPCDAPPI